MSRIENGGGQELNHGRPVTIVSPNGDIGVTAHSYPEAMSLFCRIAGIRRSGDEVSSSTVYEIHHGITNVPKGIEGID